MLREHILFFLYGENIFSLPFRIFFPTGDFVAQLGGQFIVLFTNGTRKGFTEDIDAYGGDRDGDGLGAGQ